MRFGDEYSLVEWQRADALSCRHGGDRIGRLVLVALLPRAEHSGHHHVTGGLVPAGIWRYAVNNAVTLDSELTSAGDSLRVAAGMLGQPFDRGYDSLGATLGRRA
jgi:hypothetical protein